MAHRAGIADRRFVDKVPSLGASVGERFLIDKELYTTLAKAVHSYGAILMSRTAVMFGGETREFDVVKS